MKLLKFIFGVVFFSALTKAADGDANKICTLSHTTATKAFPSLVKCYRNNISACCVSAHDSVIGDAIGSLLTDACIRSFRELELYFCYGCYFEEPATTN